MPIVKNKIRFLIYLVLALIIAGGAFLIVEAKNQTAKILENSQQEAEAMEEITEFYNDYKELKQILEELDKYGIDTLDLRTELLIAQDKMRQRKYLSAKLYFLDIRNIIDEISKEYKGSIKGVVSSGDKNLDDCALILVLGEDEKAEVKSSDGGNYAIDFFQGNFKLKTKCSGYHESITDVLITKGQELEHDVELVKIVYKPKAEVKTETPAPTATNSTANSTYTYTVVNTPHGSFNAHIMTFNLASGGIRVVTDTGDDNDCADNCNVLPLSTYVSRNGGFAGIHGTYFCPADYGSCADKKGWFFWKVFNTRLNKMINEGNGLGEWSGFYAFNSAGYPRFFGAWMTAVSSGYPIYAGINSGPTMISGGAYTLNEGVLDTKQRTVKSARGAVGLKGATFYAVVVTGATVPDSGRVMEALGVDNSIVIDGGGTVAMIYNGAYKVGPGRSMPNAIVFVGN